MKEVLKIEKISKTYQAKNGEVKALKDISFSVNEGEFISIIGPSRMWKIYTFINNCRVRRKNKWKYIFKRTET